MRIGLGSDHGGFVMKEEMKKRLTDMGCLVVDQGCYLEGEVDYPDIAAETCRGILNGKYECAILICGTGIGMSIAANKVSGIRAALVSDAFSARMAREHNDANVITLGARTVGMELAWLLVKEYLEAGFLEGKHLVRVGKIMKLEGRQAVSRTKH